MPSTAIERDADGFAVRLSSPDKPYFPELGLTKLDVANYVIAVGDGLLAVLRNRPTTLERWPGGVQPGATITTQAGRGAAFYQKKAPASMPEHVRTATVTYPSGRTAQQVTPTCLADLLWMVNLGSLRFHAWPVTAPETELVDQLRLDRDPQPSTGIAEARRVALELRGLLAELGLASFCKASCGRGLHVYAPVEPIDFIDGRHAAIAIGRELARRMPAQVTVDWWKEERGGRIFVDYNQMASDRLMASAYSIRPVPEALVSAPLDWDEVADVDPREFTVATMSSRFQQIGDPWEPLYRIDGASLSTALDWYERDAAAGQGEMPYPPEYPKMPGEPARVQPSRARKDG